MSSIAGILNTARNAIYAHQTAVQVASHNIANAQTEGYSRQRVEYAAGRPLVTPDGSVGSGVVITNVSRMRDQLADIAVRRETGRAASYGVRSDIMGQVEGVFGEPSELGLASTMDRFWNSWSDLANQPTSSAARSLVRQRGEQVASSLNHASARLDEVTDDVRSRISTTIAEVNRLAKQVAEINGEVVRAEASGNTAGDLRDTRDRLVDQISGLVSTRVHERSNGTLAVVVDGLSLVDGGTHKTLTSQFDGASLSVFVGTDRMNFAGEGSQLRELVRVHNTDIPGVRADLDTLARGLVTEVNELHRQGKTAAGDALGGKPAGWDATADASLVDFFEEPADASTISARSISLSAAVVADASVIASGYTAGATGDNRMALDAAALRDDMTTMGGSAGATSYDGYYRRLVTRVAQEVTSAENSVTVYESLVTHAVNRRESVSGVSTDEELIRLMQSQQAYVAATRLVSTVDEMTQSLLSMI